MMNPFESGARKVIPATLIYARCEDQILMIHRNGNRELKTEGALSVKDPDFHAGKWNGLGGKCELDESPVDAACREFSEEAGFKVPLEKFKSLGVLQFPNFKPHKQEDWIVFVFAVQLTTSDLPPEMSQGLSGRDRRRGITHSEEGTLHWVHSRDLMSLNLWPGDRHFIPFVLLEKPFMGTIWYDNFEVSRVWIQSLSLTIK